MSYFKNLPTIFYNGQQAKNLMSRAALSDQTKKDLSIYYPYTIKEKDGRTESLAYSYYGSADSDWMLYFANEVVDPYFGMGLNQQDFDAFIAKKYGSVQLAQQKVAFYRTNWDLMDDSSITTEAYEVLSASERKYWTAIPDASGSIIRYERKKEDLIINTNRIFTISISNLDRSEFIVGEKLSIYDDEYFNIIIGDDLILGTDDDPLVTSYRDYNSIESTKYGFCEYANSSTILIKSTTGMNTSNVSDSIVVGYESGAIASLDSIVLSCENLTSNVESTYWKSVSYYDHEDEKNTEKRNIFMIDKAFKSKMESELKRSMRK